MQKEQVNAFDYFLVYKYRLFIEKRLPLYRTNCKTTNMKRVLIVEDDVTFGTMLKSWLCKKGFDASTTSTVARAQKAIDSDSIDLILSDLRLPDKDGIELLSWCKESGHSIPFIIMTSYAEIQSAVQAMKMGACDYIAKPFNPEELLKKIDEATATPKPIVDKESSKQKSNLAKNNTSTHTSSYLEGVSAVAKQLYSHVALVAPTNMSVLINGASGTGKEYVAKRIHELSSRKDKPFIAIDCGAMPKDLAASEFFGHIKGSFTGALADKVGAFEAANGGTIFLDEVGNLSYEVQIQLLRALQERRIRPVGSPKEIQVDIRIVSATNENLQKAIENGSFREDLFHRLNEFTLVMPTLKERKEDIMLFANFFLNQANAELNKSIIGFGTDATVQLMNYPWPGNLREMKNVIKRATLLSTSDFVTPLELGLPLATGITDTIKTDSIELRNKDSEKEQILEALRRTNNNKSKAAQLLNIDRKTLYNKLKLYELDTI